MRFALRRFSKAIAIGALGCAAAVLVACGDRSGLLPGDDASRLSSALDGVQGACSRGAIDAAAQQAARFQAEVERLRGRGVDRRLVAGLRDGGETLAQLVPGTCEDVVETTTDTVETTPTTPTAPVDPATTPTTPSTTPTTPVEPVEPPTTTPPATTPPADGGTTPPSDGGTGGDTGGGTTPPDDAGTGGDTGGTVTPDDGQGNEGGAVAPGQGGTP